MSMIRPHNPKNTRIALQLEAAAACITDLAQHGAVIERVELGHHEEPRIHLERRARCLSVKNPCVIDARGPHTEHTYRQRYHDCQVEWVEVAR